MGQGRADAGCQQLAGSVALFAGFFAAEAVAEIPQARAAG